MKTTIMMRVSPAVALALALAIAPAHAQCPAGVTKGPVDNIKTAAVLSQLDLNQDGAPDGSFDCDGDGLPDLWETNVTIFAPTAIGPGTPSTFLTSRLQVTTNPTRYDTDGDGLSDFIEVFGLKFIDDNGNGRLDFLFTDSNANGRWDVGERIDGRSEWLDINNDGMPSVGEQPFENLFGKTSDGTTVYWVDDTDGDTIPDTVVFNGAAPTVLETTSVHGGALALPTRVNIGGTAVTLLVRAHDFDGFLFTDPTDPDTDGDGVNDKDDSDPLINPATFGKETAERGDIDGDGLGNATDFGNDSASGGAIIDNPAEIADLVSLFRGDRTAKRTIPESLIEDLVGADWNGDGLFRITDVRQFRRMQTGAGDCLSTSILGGDLAATTPDSFLAAGPGNSIKFYATRGSGACAAVPTDSSVGLGPDTVNVPTDYGIIRQGLGFQTLLLPYATTNQIAPAPIPDRRVWAILYAWRVPGFDIDGDGFIGSPEDTFRVDDRHRFSNAGSSSNRTLDGVITAPTCGIGTFGAALASMVGVAGLGVAGGWARRRR